MLTSQENDLLCRVEGDAPMGQLMRRHWTPVCLIEEVSEPDGTPVKAKVFGEDLVEPAIFFIGLQPHTHLEQYGFDQGLIKPGYNPMSMMPWTARKLLWNPEPMGSTFGRVCLEAFDRDPSRFGKTVMEILERDYGTAPLEEALRAPVEGRKALATATR